MRSGQIAVRILSLTAVALVLALAAASGLAASPQSAPPAPSPRSGMAPAVVRDGPIIADHTTTRLGEIPPEWIVQSKAALRLSYGHTSHGSQVVSGMGALRDGPYGALYALTPTAR